MRLAGFIGLFLILAVACRSDNVAIGVSFQTVDGLQRGDRVLFESNPAGRIEAVEYGNDGTYLARLQVDKGFANALTQYSNFQIVDDPGEPGRKAIEIALTQPGGKRLPEGAVVKGTSREGFLDPLLEKDLEAGLRYIREQADRLAREIRQIPESEAYRRLKKNLSDLAAEIARAEAQTREKLKEEWLPQIEKDLDTFKKHLREFGREEDARPLEKELDRIRKI